MLPTPEQVREEPVAWTTTMALGLWVLALVGSTIWILMIGGLSGQEPGSLSRNPPWLFLSQLGLWAIYGLGPLVVARQLDPTRSPKEIFGLDMKSTDIPIWASIGVAMQLIVIPLLYLPISQFVDTESVSEAAQDIIDNAVTWMDVGVLFLMIVVIAPVVEEFFYRGFALPALMARFGPWPAVIVSSLWFAASHFQVIQFPGLLVVGLALAVARVRTNRLIPCILLHMAFNGVTFGVLVSQLSLT
ncbi:MAG: CPBP family intramembrane metalloprotease [Acidimicrobiales bacterium]|nr:CPBP family intramembrane metalloprotease [Acidimicrobiales bacterium]